MSDRPFLFNVVVWGEEYTRHLAEFTIPSLLAPQNLPALVERRSCEFMIITTPVDAELLRSYPTYQTMAELLPVRFEHIPLDESQGSKYDRMTRGHYKVCEYGQPLGAFGVFLMPEMLVADGTLLYLHKSVERGSRAIVMPVFRLVTEEVDRLRGLPVISIPNRDLVQLLFEHAHHEMRTFMVNGHEFSASPGFVIWNLEGKNTWIIHGLHTQPVVVDLLNAQPDSMYPSLDAGNFVLASVSDVNVIDVVDDSDLAMMCSLTSVNDIPTPHHWVQPTPTSVRNFILGTPYINTLHRWYFGIPVIFHSGEIPEDIDLNLEASAQFVKAVLV